MLLVKRLQGRKPQEAETLPTHCLFAVAEPPRPVPAGALARLPGIERVGRLVATPERDLHRGGPRPVRPWATRATRGGHGGAPIRVRRLQKPLLRGGE